MYKLTFNNDEMAINYVNGLFEAGLRLSDSIEKTGNGFFYIKGNDVYISVI